MLANRIRMAMADVAGLETGGAGTVTQGYHAGGTGQAFRRSGERLSGIRPFRVMEVMARAGELERAGRAITHMEIGEPDFATAVPIVEAAERALRAGHTGYTPAAGLPALREAVAAYYANRYRVEVAPERVLITPGASGALQLALAWATQPSDEVLLADPGYPCNRSIVQFLTGRVAPVATDAASRYQLSAELLTPRIGTTTAALLLASPSNPTGTVLAREQMLGLAQLARGHGLRLVVDEIYHGLVYDADCHSALEVEPDAFVINSFSKFFGMTGWRLGWLIAPEAAIRDMERLQQNLFIAPSTPAQHAAVAAFGDAAMAVHEERREQYRRRRDYLVPALRELGFRIPVVPEGAFYLYAECNRFERDSETLTALMLEEAGVAATPGTDFGEYRAREHVRFAYTTSMESLERGVDRLARVLGPS